jgi:proton-translocating NADH-quinone oxidoreductase chain M
LFEFILVPFYFIVLFWGSRANRVGASFRLVFFTLVFSLPLTVLVALNLYNAYFSFNFDILFSTLSTNNLFLQITFYAACFMAFAVKIPLFPAHVWLPEAHGEAPTFGSVLLAGILLKLGGYGFYQVFYEFVNPSWGMNLINIFSAVYVISVLTIFYSNIVVFNQLDIKRTIAYYSIGHMGFVTLGLISGNQEAMIGAVIIMLSHGLSAAGLFFCVGYIYEQAHTRSIIAFRGLATHAPYLSIIIFLFVCANISFPGTSNFIGEQLVLVGLAKLTPILTFLPMFGVFFGGLSTFLFYIRIVFGEFQETSVAVRDLNTWQLTCLLFVILPLVVVGFFPSIVIETITSLF